MEEEVRVPPGRMSPAAEDFIRSCLQKDPCSRPSTEALLQHPWTQVRHARRCPYRPAYKAMAISSWPVNPCLWCCDRAHETAVLTQRMRMLSRPRAAAPRAQRRPSCPQMLVWAVWAACSGELCAFNLLNAMRKCDCLHSIICCSTASASQCRLLYLQAQGGSC